MYGGAQMEKIPKINAAKHDLCISESLKKVESIVFGSTLFLRVL